MGMGTAGILIDFLKVSDLWMQLTLHNTIKLKKVTIDVES